MTFKSNKPKSTETTRPPVAKLRIGLINASIWERQIDDSAYYSVSFERRYKDGEGNWQSTHSFNPEDLPTLAKLADQAHSRVLEFQSGLAE